MDVEFRNPTIYIIGGKAKHGKDTFMNVMVRK